MSDYYDDSDKNSGVITGAGGLVGAAGAYGYHRHKNKDTFKERTEIKKANKGLVSKSDEMNRAAEKVASDHKAVFDTRKALMEEHAAEFSAQREIFNTANEAQQSVNMLEAFEENAATIDSDIANANRKVSRLQAEAERKGLVDTESADFKTRDIKSEAEIQKLPKKEQNAARRLNEDIRAFNTEHRDAKAVAEGLEIEKSSIGETRTRLVEARGEAFDALHDARESAGYSGEKLTPTDAADLGGIKQSAENDFQAINNKVDAKVVEAHPDEQVRKNARMLEKASQERMVGDAGSKVKGATKTVTEVPGKAVGAAKDAAADTVQSVDRKVRNTGRRWQQRRWGAEEIDLIERPAPEKGPVKATEAHPRSRLVDVARHSGEYKKPTKTKLPRVKGGFVSVLAGLGGGLIVGNIAERAMSGPKRGPQYADPYAQVQNMAGMPVVPNEGMAGPVVGGHTQMLADQQMANYGPQQQGI